MINKFVAYLKNRNESALQFSLRSHIAYNTIKKAIRGEAIRKDSAKKFVKASKKQLTLEDFVLTVPSDDNNRDPS